jgi:predicted transcriptional regulator
MKIDEGSPAISRSGSYGTVLAHIDCLEKLKDLLTSVDSSNHRSAVHNSRNILEQMGSDWILVRRDVPNTISILAYLDKMDSACDVKVIYDWLNRNEISISNPSDSIAKLKKTGMISVFKSKEKPERQARITEKGKKTIKDFESEPLTNVIESV